MTADPLTPNMAFEMHLDLYQLIESTTGRPLSPDRRLAITLLQDALVHTRKMTEVLVAPNQVNAQAAAREQLAEVLNLIDESATKMAEADAADLARTGLAMITPDPITGGYIARSMGLNVEGRGRTPMEAMQDFSEQLKIAKEQGGKPS